MEKITTKKPSLKKLEVMIWEAIEKHIANSNELVDREWGLDIDWGGKNRGRSIVSDSPWDGDCRCALSCVIDKEKDVSLIDKLGDWDGIEQLISLKLNLDENMINAFTNGFDGKKGDDPSLQSEYPAYFKLGQKIRRKAIKHGYLKSSK